MKTYYKLYLLIISTLLLPFLTQAQMDAFTLSYKRVTVTEAMQIIEKEAGIKFAYSSDVVKIDKSISIQVNEVSLAELLNYVFHPMGISWYRSGNTVTLYQPDRGNRFTISGYITEAGSGERLIGVLVSVKPARSGGLSNAYGFYSITLPADTYSITFQYTGFQDKTYKLIINSNTDLNVQLNSAANLQEVVVSASAIKPIAQLSTFEVPMHQLEQVPALLGEKDVVRYMMMQPGVQKGNEGSNYLYVRGGSSDQNLVLIDDAVIYNAHHFLGLSSLFTGSELRRAELIKGGFSAKYGGRLSSVLDLSMKDGNREKFSGEATIGAISSRLLLESPIIKNRSSVLVSYRRSYLDKISAAVAPKNQALNYAYDDFHGKISTDIGSKDRLYFSTYVGNDLFINQSESENLNQGDDKTEWGNKAFSFRWNHQFSARLFSNTTIAYSNYNNSFSISDVITENGIQSRTASGISSDIQDLSIKNDWDFMHSSARFKFGVGINERLFTPVARLYFKNELLGIDRNDVSQANFGNTEYSAYAEMYKTIMQKIDFVSGARFSAIHTGSNDYARIEPRFSMLYSVNSRLKINSTYALMNQYVHQITNMGFGLPVDLWMPVTNKVKPQRSHQISGGATYLNLLNLDITIAIEGFYKYIENAVSMREGGSFFSVVPGTLFTLSPNDWNDLITQGKANAYGLESYLRKNGEHFSGWISYTYSKTTMQFESINRGRPFAFTYDRTHDLGIFVSWFSGVHFRASCGWIYGTGNAITLPVGSFIAPERDFQNGNGLMLSFFDYEQKNNYRMRAYHRFDCALQYYHRLSKTILATLDFSVYNVYNRANPFFYQIDNENADGTGKRIIRQTSLFPIIPSLSYTIKF
jgi:hypothetical protein